MVEMRYNKALNAALSEEMNRDDTVIIAGEDVAGAGGSFGVTRGLLEQFGENRVIDTPISESAIVGMAVGAAAAGIRPVVEIMFMDFLAVCFDPILNQAAKMSFMTAGGIRLPMVIRTQSGAGMNAGPQHSQSLEAMLIHIPGIKVVAPSNPRDAKGLLKAAIRDENPVIFIEHKGLYGLKGEVPDEEYFVPLGKAAVAKEGGDCTIIATGQMVHRAMEAAGRLESGGIQCEVIDPRTLLPLDMETILTSVKKTGRLVIVHEAVKNGGIGAEIAASVQEEAFYDLKAPIRRVAAPFSPVPFSKTLESAYLPDVEDICKAVQHVCSEDSARARENRTTVSTGISSCFKHSTPLAKRIAEAENVPLDSVNGTGFEGKITKKDVLGTAENKKIGEFPPQTELRNMTPMRKTIAKRMSDSWHTIPHVTLTTEAVVTDLLTWRKAYNERSEQEKRAKITLTALVVKALATAVPIYPQMNVSLQDGSLRYYSDVHIGIAVALENGLIVPVLKQADRKSLDEIGSEIKRLADKAKKGLLQEEEMTGGRFTVSNLGQNGIDTFTPIINLPESAILGVGRTVEKPLVHEGSIDIGYTMALSLSFDHRVVDGAPAAEFLQSIKRNLENPNGNWI